MSLGDIVGQLLQKGLSGGSRGRLDHALGNSGLGGVGGLEDILGGLLGAQGGAGARTGGGGSGAGAGGLGGLLEMAAGALGGRSSGGAPSGGLGGLAGVLLGGRAASSGRGALGNNGMAILGTLAVAAFKHWQQSQGGSAAGAMPAMNAQQFAELTSPQTERLILRAMISAAKADGEVDEDEIQRIVGKIDDDGVSPDEKQFIMDELRKPADLHALVADVPDQLVAAEVYAASLLAINLDTPAEQSYLQQLAQLLQLDQLAVQRLHALTGVGVA